VGTPSDQNFQKRFCYQFKINKLQMKSRVKNHPNFQKHWGFERFTTRPVDFPARFRCASTKDQKTLLRTLESCASKQACPSKLNVQR